jgi:methionine synthase II (cobalamin-independent)
LSEQTTRWLPEGAATLVGSMPHKDRERVIAFTVEEMGEIPVWPQLSAYHREQMMVQFTEGLPGLVIRNGRSAFLTRGPQFEEELLAFYEEYLSVVAGDLPLGRSRFRLGHENGRTLFAFLEYLAKRRAPVKGVKGQIVGPFTLLSGLKDEDDRLALYDSRLRDVVVKALALKAQWQTELLGRFDAPPVIFIDEPVMSGFGSTAFISVSAADVRAMLEEVVSHIHQAGGLAGVHVCGNTDWSILFGSSVDIINFDSYTYFERFALYREDLASFLKRGGIVAWGLVPTADEDLVSGETSASLVQRWVERGRELTGPELSLGSLLHHSLITPSCGCGSLSEAIAERVVRLTRQVSETLRRELPGC